MNIVEIDRERFVLDILIGIFKGKQMECAKGMGVSKYSLTSFLDGNEKEKRSYKFESAFNEFCIAKGIDPKLYFIPKNSS